MSEGTETMAKLAGCVMALRESRHTVLQLSGRTGAHRRTVSKWLQTLERAGQVKPHGTGSSGRFGNGCAVLWEWVEKPAEPAPRKEDPAARLAADPRFAGWVAAMGPDAESANAPLDLPLSEGGQP